MNPTQIGSFENIPLAAIRPSTTNPRKHFDQAALDELAGSIREMGVTQPILIRPNGKAAFPGEPVGEPYELVTGERRWRAAEIAGRTDIPAFIRELSDQEAMDLQLVENLQREDLHPVEEADGYRALMANGASAEDVAKKVGKTLGYVQRRLKLLTLEVDAKQLFADGHLTLGHALLLARLTAKDQEKALLYLLGIRDWEIDKKLDFSKNIVRHVKNASGEYGKLGRGGRLVNETEAQLKEWISSHVLLQLKTAPWDLGDAELLPIAGPCTTCPKRTGANAALFSDITTNEDTCTDPACFADKQKAFTRRQQEIAKEAGTPLLKISSKHSTEKLEKPAVEIRPSAVKAQSDGAGKVRAVETQRAAVVATRPVKEGQWVPSKKGACPATVQAIATDGPEQGKLRYVCADQQCKVHTHVVRSAPARPSGTGRASGETWEQQQKRRIALAEREVPVRVALFKALLPKLKPTADELRNIVLYFLDDGDDDHFEIVCLARGWSLKTEVRHNFRASDARTVLQREANRMATPDELLQLLIELRAAEAFGVSEHSMEDKGHRADALKAAKKYKVDADKIIAKAEAEMQPVALAAAAAKVPAAAKKGGKK